MRETMFGLFLPLKLVGSLSIGPTFAFGFRVPGVGFGLKDSGYGQVSRLSVASGCLNPKP